MVQKSRFTIIERMTILFFLIIPLIVSCESSEKKQPNIILIIADDCGWKDVSFNGSNYYETPSIDQLAAEGMIFTDAYSNAPFCTPSRASLFSGLYSPKHDIYIPGTTNRGLDKARKLVVPENLNYLDTSFLTMAEPLKNIGYTTGYFGKWQLSGGNQKFDPDNRGFDIFIGGDMQPTYFFPYHQRNNKTISPIKNLDLSIEKKGEYLTDRLTDEAIKFIRLNRDKPFFLTLAHWAPHVPLEAKPELVEKYKRKPGDGLQNNPVYAAMIESLDQSVGKIMLTLDEMNLTENTLVIFHSDNGGFALATSNKPLRGSKGNLYEGGIRVPFIARWPGTIEAGTTSHEPVIGVDLFPTFLEITGISRDSFKLDGTSILPILEGTEQKLEREAIYWFMPNYLDSYDSAYYKNNDVEDRIVLTEFGRIKQDSTIECHPSRIYPGWRLKPCNAVRKGDYKLIHYFEGDELELYNLREDIGETKNLSKEMPGKTEELYKLLDNWRITVNAPYPLEINPEYDSLIYRKY